MSDAKKNLDITTMGDSHQPAPPKDGTATTQGDSHQPAPPAALDDSHQPAPPATDV
ncbi:sigma-like protein [Streptomyces sp. NPDC005562]|uniref:sigma-like protein n=1 Tax=unclassified Streptomyces TaxID=2593676 RepID=UPI0033A99FEE